MLCLLWMNQVIFELSAQVDNMTESQFIFKLGVNNLVPKLTLSARSKNKRILLIWLVFKFQWIKHQCTSRQHFDHIFRLCNHHRQSSICTYFNSNTSTPNQSLWEWFSNIQTKEVENELLRTTILTAYFCE